ncbi:hypothetical protein ACFL4G_03175 [Thermodesulfobacteriota bacterium]
MKNPYDPRGRRHPTGPPLDRNPGVGYGSPVPERRPQAAFDEFDAFELYCPKCARSVPVRKRLLLALPEGDKYEYLCDNCSESLGTKLDKGTPGESRLIY